MKLKQRVVRTMNKGLPPEEQVLMVTDFLNWLFSDCAPTECQKKLAFWTPILIKDISAGKYGLWLLIFHYMKCFVSLRWLRYCFNQMRAPREDHIAR
jgi:hypothetical protein